MTSRSVLGKRDAESLEFEGLRTRDYTSSVDGSASLAVVSVPSGGGHPPARSERSDKYTLVVDGAVSFTVGNEDAILEEGDACVVRRGEVFSYRNHTGTSARLVLLHTPPHDHRFERFVASQDQSTGGRLPSRARSDAGPVPSG